MQHLYSKETKNYKFPDPQPKGRYFGVKSVKFMYFFKNFLFYSGGLFRQTKYIVIMTREGSTKIVIVMTSRTGVLVLGCGHISHIVKTHYFFKNLIYSHAWIRRTTYKVMMTKERSTKIVNFMTPRAGVLMLGRGHYKSLQ